MTYLAAIVRWAANEKDLYKTYDCLAYQNTSSVQADSILLSFVSFYFVLNPKINMKHLIRFTSLVTALTFAHAAPTISTKQAVPAPINTQCINFEYRQGWLIAECLTSEDSTTRIQSAVYLPNKIANNDGSLQWGAA